MFENNKDSVACVIMEPTIAEFPSKNFLAEVKDITKKNGALLIFDEMLTGFRFHLGGAQSYFGVIPDLAAFGKGLANGMPIAFLAGKAEYMQHFEEVFFSTTYGGEALSLAAGIAGVDYYKKHDVIKRLWKSGKIIMDNFNRLIHDKEMQDYVSVVGYPVRQQILFKDKSGEADYRLPSLYQQEMLKRGIICYAGLGFSSAHTDEELMYTVYAFSDALDVLKKAIEENDLNKYLEGKPPEPVFKALRDSKQTSN